MDKLAVLMTCVTLIPERELVEAERLILPQGLVSRQRSRRGSLEKKTKHIYSGEH